jgi:hypothetical protein
MTSTINPIQECENQPTIKMIFRHSEIKIEKRDAEQLSTFIYLLVRASVGACRPVPMSLPRMRQWQEKQSTMGSPVFCSSQPHRETRQGARPRAPHFAAESSLNFWTVPVSGSLDGSRVLSRKDSYGVVWFGPVSLH